jgi:hypothetical protein
VKLTRGEEGGAQAQVEDWSPEDGWSSPAVRWVEIARESRKSQGAEGEVRASGSGSGRKTFLKMLHGRTGQSIVPV